MNTQLDRWCGQFGIDYTERNIIDPGTRANAFGRLLPPDVRSVLEVGANAGHNLLAIQQVRPDISAFGAEPAEYAREVARAKKLVIYARSIYDLPSYRRQFDLAFTCGVLIHIPPDRLDEALTALHCIARRYLLAIEYRADTDTAIDYRDHADMLWKRDYGAHYQRLFPKLTLIGEGELTAADGFAGDYYWLLKK
jgi:pseudaminic acid biosynthesis-associated methylase